jgi:ABC-type bacteriocin/lantibiotic exporter with double-glycine peptidase domain
MVLDYLGVTVEAERLRRLLGTTEQGTPFFNLVRLETLGLFITAGTEGDLSIFDHFIELGLPVIVGVSTFGWQHWAGEVVSHAVVVVGIDHERSVIYLNDPAFADAPIEMSFTEFEIGWEEQYRSYAVIGLVPP